MKNTWLDLDFEKVDEVWTAWDVLDDRRNADEDHLRVHKALKRFLLKCAGSEKNLHIWSFYGKTDLSSLPKHSIASLMGWDLNYIRSTIDQTAFQIEQELPRLKELKDAYY